MELPFVGGIQLVVLLQTIPWLEAPMRFFTFLGTAEFFFLVLPVIYWCVDAGLGVRIGFILLFSNGFNEILKLVFQSARPYWISAQVKALAAEATFGLPSGHAQIAAGVWGTIAARVGRAWAWVAALALIFCIGLSRVYLGVHFPADVLAGWVLGGLTLWAFVAYWERTTAWLRRSSLLTAILLVLAVAVLMVVANALLVHALRGYVLPADWAVNAARAGVPLPPQISMENILTSAGALIGLAFGLLWMERRGGHKPSGSIWQRAMCFLLGLTGVLILYLGLKIVLPDDDSLLGSCLRLVRYGAIGLWVSAGAPVLFQQLKLV